MAKAVAKKRNDQKKFPRMFLIPCSCGTTFAIAEDFDRQGTHMASQLPSLLGCSQAPRPPEPRLRMDYNQERLERERL
jgi:hypothetical protein